MNILVTGASGFIGEALVETLRSGGNSIFCQSRSFHEEELGVKWLKHDLVNASWEDMSLPEIDIIYHLAGQTSTYVARQSPITDLSANVLAFLNLLDHFRKQKRSPFVVLTGTVTEVGLTDQLPINESLPDRPITFYDISKLTAEMYLKQYVREGFVKGCTLRLPNVFGRNQAGQQRDRGILDKIFIRALSGQNITVYGDGSSIRDYLFIDDVVSALVLASEKIEQTNGRIFCLGSGKGITLKNAFLKVINAATSVNGRSVELIHIKPPAGMSAIEYRNAIIDSSEFTKATGWLPRFSFDDAIAKTYYEPNSK